MKRSQLIILMMDYAIQWEKACKYKHADEYTLKELKDWIEEFVDFRIKFDEIDKKSQEV